MTDDIWHMTCDRWQVTCDRSHMTHKCDTWQMTHSVGWTFSQNCSSLALLVWDWQCLEDIWNKGWLNESINQWASEVILEQPWIHRVYVYNVHSLVRSITKKFTWLIYLAIYWGALWKSSISESECSEKLSAWCPLAEYWNNF